MSYEFPELNTIGALFRFAAIMEQVAIDTLRAAASSSAGGDPLLRLATKHERRAEELERARKEKLNETVLEPLMDMPNTPYLPSIPDDLESQDTKTLLATALDVEQRTALFYRDAVTKAGPVLAEVRRLFARFEKESVKSTKSLEEMAA